MIQKPYNLRLMEFFKELEIINKYVNHFIQWYLNIFNSYKIKKKKFTCIYSKFERKYDTLNFYRGTQEKSISPLETYSQGHFSNPHFKYLKNFSWIFLLKLLELLLNYHDKA